MQTRRRYPHAASPRRRHEHARHCLAPLETPTPADEVGAANEPRTEGTGASSLVVCLVPAWQGGSWLWVWHDVLPQESLLEHEIETVLLASRIEDALRNPYITLVKVRGAEVAQEWVCAELQRLGVHAPVVQQGD